MTSSPEQVEKTENKESQEETTESLNCGYCGHTMTQTHGPREDGAVESTLSCDLCGYTDTRVRWLPSSEDIEFAKKLQTESFYEIVNSNGERIYEGDFLDKEEADVVAEYLQGQLHMWSMKDRDALPVPHKTTCTCGEQKYRFEVKTVEIPSKEGVTAFHVCKVCPALAFRRSK